MRPREDAKHQSECASKEQKGQFPGGWVGKKQKRRKQGLSEAKTFVSATVRDSDETLRSFEAESE